MMTSVTRNRARMGNYIRVECDEDVSLRNLRTDVTRGLSTPRDNVRRGMHDLYSGIENGQIGGSRLPAGCVIRAVEHDDHFRGSAIGEGRGDRALDQLAPPAYRSDDAYGRWLRRKVIGFQGAGWSGSCLDAHHCRPGRTITPEDKPKLVPDGQTTPPPPALQTFADMRAAVAAGIPARPIGVLNGGLDDLHARVGPASADG
jgi:hypothetical protein